ncbi:MULTISPECIES: CopC domain-containing protein YobA [Citrobacter]|uniref:CopC domain-containing protein YobA n=1 Tax=Citrobacter TaxID=544 RepID=UPI0002673EF3|nr:MULTISPECIES: CopC domain-containing protein YobA [Citrobacter]EIQ80426.1 protein YobA [Shigella flexneri 1235-66]MBA4712540.1 CopC domain-containing protein YobA [Citrobacter pasteurii]MBA7943251.1 CopC domain-containing protein YobA [Citrobacter sp. RHBSTW-00271]MBD0800742.1 CopC domain-containing protein YobA [Citrobacter sp. C6_1]MBD0809226.1 CopC domain-containing protein YobA [Citrobacter sp. C6_2]
MASSASMLRSALIVLASVLATPAALAHAHLTKQNPAANAEVTTSPQALTLNFSEGVEPGFSGATLTDPNKEQIKTGKAMRNEQDKTQLIIPLVQSLETGKYTVDWHVVSVDGHKTKGQYSFSVK